MNSKGNNTKLPAHYGKTMELQIISKQEDIPTFDPNKVAVKHIEYYLYGRTYNEDEITPELISKILKEIPKEIGIYLYLDPAGNVTGWRWFQMENGYFLAVALKMLKSVDLIIIILIIPILPTRLSRLWK